MKKPTPAELFLQQRLKDLRAASARTQAETSEQAGLSEIYYQAIEAGRRRNVSLEMIEKIAASYGLTVYELFAPSLPTIKNISHPVPRAHYRRR